MKVVTDGERIWMDLRGLRTSGARLPSRRISTVIRRWRSSSRSRMRTSSSGMRAGDEEAFMELIRSLNHVARCGSPHVVRPRPSPKNVVQETWLAVLNGIDRSKGILAEDVIFPHPPAGSTTAKTRGERGSGVRFRSRHSTRSKAASSRLIERSRFTGAGHWAVLPRAWPEDRLLAKERSVAKLALNLNPSRTNCLSALLAIPA